MKPIVLGTAVATDGRSFATVQLGDGRPTLVHVGGKIGEWVVKAIERGKIVLVSSSGFARRRHRAQARNLICRLYHRIANARRRRRAASSPAGAQRGGQTRARSRPPKAGAEARHDEEERAGVSLDFQDQDLKVVLDALAAAGDLNVSLTNIPSQRVTLHMGKPVTREGDDRAGEERRRVERPQGHADGDADSDFRSNARAGEPSDAGAAVPRAAAAAAESAAADAAVHVSAQARERGSARAGAHEPVFRVLRRRRGRGRHDDLPERQRRIHDDQHGRADQLIAGAAAGQHHDRSVHAGGGPASRWRWSRRGRGAAAATNPGVQGRSISWRTRSSRRADRSRVRRATFASSPRSRATRCSFARPRPTSRSSSRSFRASICVRCRC